MTKFLRFRRSKLCFILLISLSSEAALALSYTEKAHKSIIGARMGQAKRLIWLITGKVISNGEPLPGVSIRLKGTEIGTTTGIDDNYSLNVPENGGTLVFSFLGFITQEKTFSRAGTVNVTLLEDSKALDEVLVVGYGTQTKSQVTGAISSVSAKEISELPLTNAQQALQGRAVGVEEVLSAGNRPGDGVNVRIRGRRSFNAGNDPLYVVDGIPLSGGINDINPQDIQSMEILKDASSTAIYGSRGANGVVIITTKKGVSGKTSINFDSYYGISKPIDLYNVMNGVQYAEYKRESRRAIGKYNDADPVNADKAVQYTNDLLTNRIFLKI
ncbi:MAG: TonB-dependent receptor plug domain-containing protein [Daejeonella sp.]